MLSSNIPYLQFFLVLGLGQIFAAEWRRKAAPVLLLHKAWPGRTGARKASGGPVLDICGQRVHAGGLSCLSVFGAGHKRPCLPCSADKAAGDSAAHHLADRAYLHGGHAALGGIFGQHRPVAVRRLHSAFAAGVAMALGIFGLPLLAQNMPAGISQWLDLLPHDASGLYGELMRANLFHVFSLRIWSPWMFPVFTGGAGSRVSHIVHAHMEARQIKPGPAQNGAGTASARRAVRCKGHSRRRAAHFFLAKKHKI